MGVSLSALVAVCGLQPKHLARAGICLRKGALAAWSAHVPGT